MSLSRAPYVRCIKKKGKKRKKQKKKRKKRKEKLHRRRKYELVGERARFHAH